MTIHFLAPVVRERLGMLHWITDPACSGFIITYDLRGDHVLISNFDVCMSIPSEAIPDPKVVRKAQSRILDTRARPEHSLCCHWSRCSIRSEKLSAMGSKPKGCKALQKGQSVPVSLFPVQALKAMLTFYASIGDAAHSFPPTGGLGLNSGIADAHNIAYKLAAVHYGWARSSILDSFEGDRRQVALVNSAQSVKNGKQIFSFLKSLGTAGVKDEQEARENLHRSVHDPRMRGKIAEEVEAQREHFDNVCIPSLRILLTHFLPSNGLT